MEVLVDGAVVIEQGQVVASVVARQHLRRSRRQTPTGQEVAVDRSREEQVLDHLGIPSASETLNDQGRSVLALVPYLDLQLQHMASLLKSLIQAIDRRSSTAAPWHQAEEWGDIAYMHLAAPAEPDWDRAAADYMAVAADGTVEESTAFHFDFDCDEGVAADEDAAVGPGAGSEDHDTGLLSGEALVEVSVYCSTSPSGDHDLTGCTPPDHAPAPSSDAGCRTADPSRASLHVGLHLSLAEGSSPAFRAS